MLNFIFLSILFSTTLLASPTERMYNFAESLYKEDLLELALREYQDFLELYPSSSKTTQVQEKIIKIYIERQKFEKALNRYHIIHSLEKNPSMKHKYALEIGKLYEKFRMENEAQKTYLSIINSSTPSEYQEKAQNALLRINKDKVNMATTN